MKSIFTKLGTLLLCGVVAMVSCTDFSEDIKGLDNKITGIDSETQTELASLQKAITDLEAKLSAQYATKDEVAALKTTLENSIASEVAALSEDIAEVSAALSTAKNEINTAIAGLDDKKADKTAVEAAVKTATDAIAALQTELEAAKGDLEAEIAAVKKQIADTQEALQEQINGVDAKANELQNTLLSLGEYLKTLEAKVNEINNTLISLGEYLPTIEAKILEVKGTVESLGAEYEANKEVVDAKLSELFSTLVSLSNHLEEYEKATDFKLVELQGSLAALSTYLEEYEDSVDDKFNEILNTFESLSLFLDEKFAALEATDTDLYKEIEGIRVVLSALNNLLTDETAARESEDAALYELIGSSVTALNNLIADLASEDEALYAELDGVRQAFTALNNLLADESATREAEDAAIYELIGSSVTALNNLIADLEAADEAIYAEIENVRTYVAQVYNALSTEIAATDAALKAHIAAFEAFKAVYEAKVAELEATDEDLYLEINGLREVITTVNNHIEDLRAEDEAIYLEINGLRENLTQLQNAIDNRIDEEVKALKADILEKFNILNTVILETEKRVNDKFNHTLKLIAANTEAIAENAAAIADLEAAVEILKDWIAGQEETNDQYAQLIAGVYEIVGEIEEQIAALTQKDGELEGLIGKTAGALQTYMDENDARLADLEIYINENFNQFGSAIRSLEAIINDLQASFGARLDALEERMDAAEEKIDDLEKQTAKLEELLAELQYDLRTKADELYNAIKQNSGNIANNAQAIADLKKDIKRIDEVIEDIQKQIEDNKAAMEAGDKANADAIAKNAEAILDIVADLAELEARFNERMSHYDAFENDVANKLKELQKQMREVNENLQTIFGDINFLKDAVEALQALAETLATKDEVAGVKAQIEKQINSLQDMLLQVIRATDDRHKSDVATLRGMIADANALIDSLEERMDAAEGDIADLEEQTAELEKAVAGLEEAKKAIEEQLATAKNTLDGLKQLCKDQETNIGANIDAINALQKAHEELIEQLEEKLDAIDESIENLETAINANKEAIAKNGAAIEDNKKLIGKNAEDIIATALELAELKAEYAAYKKHVDEQISYLWNNDSSIAEDLARNINKVLGEIEKTNANLDKVQADLTAAIGRIDVIEDAVAALEALAETLATKAEVADVKAQLEKQITFIQDMLLQMIVAAEDRANDKINQLRESVTYAYELIAGLRADVETLFNRVQSLVYVPDTDDHKAELAYGILYTAARENQAQTAFVAKESVLRYRVYAKAGQSAVEAAADVVKAWTADKNILSYEVEAVRRVGTRSAEAPAALEIRNVEVNKENPELINVTVVAKNFIDAFYSEVQPQILADGSSEGVAIKQPEKSSYSAAIVLSDGNNNRSSEYTNLVPGVRADIKAVVLDGNNKDITFRSYENAPVVYLPYDRDPAEKIILEGHRLAFFTGEEINTADQLIADGYDIQLERRVYQKQLNTEVYQDHLITLKKGEVELRQVGPFELREDPLASITQENDTYVKIREEMSKETYQALKENEQNILTIDYRYNVNGLNVNTEASAEICNRLVEVNFSVDVPWTLETAVKTENCTKDLTVPYTYDLAKAVKNNKSLEGYSLSAILSNVKSGDKHNGGHYDIALKNITADTFDVRLQSGSTKYAFPVNNEDSIKDYNTYSVSFISHFEDIDVTVNLNMNLGELAPVQKLSKNVKFTTAGENGWLYAYWNAIEDAYQKFLTDGYIGYVDAPETGKAMFRSAFHDKSAYILPPMLGVNADKTGHESNTNAPFTEYNNDKGEHMFKVSLGQLQADENGFVDGTTQTITQNFVHSYGMIPFVFTVNGTVDLPEYALDLDGARVIDREKDGKKIVEVKGEIVNNVYTVDKSDLAKYFYVVNESGVKKLTQVNPNDKLSVNFTLAPMDKATETGFYINADSVIEYALDVDWTGTLSPVPYILPMGKAIVNWGTYPHTEVEVNAVLSVNGFPIASKPITLVTEDPLEIALKDVTVEVTHLSGTNPDPIVAKVYQNFELTSAVEEGNLFNNNAQTIGGLWYFSKADTTYGITMGLQYNRVYYKVGDEKIDWDESKIVLDRYTESNRVAPYKVGDLTGKVYIRPDDGDIQTPIYVEFNVTMSHNIHDGAKTKCETSGIVTVKFVPEGYVEVAE